MVDQQRESEQRSWAEFLAAIAEAWQRSHRLPTGLLGSGDVAGNAARQYRGEIAAGAATPAREAPRRRAAVGTTRKPAVAMVTAVRCERIPITLLDDAPELAPHGSIRVRSERADAGLPESGEGGPVAIALPIARSSGQGKVAA
jgi:hypothetical protein